jgi:YVTN family beta-propeller protein
LLNIAQEVLGAEARTFRATLFDKSPQANWLVVWHQDTALPLRNRHDTPSWGPWSVRDGVVYAHAPASVLRQILALRIHLDDSTAHNGPLRVLRGTHTEGVLNDDAIHEFAAQVKPTDCLVPQVGSKPRFLAIGGGSIWTLNQGDGTVSRVDEKGRRVTATIQVGIPGAGGDIGYGAESVWPTVFGVPLTRIDASTNKVVRQWVGKGGDSLRYGFGSI